MPGHRSCYLSRTGARRWNSQKWCSCRHWQNISSNWLPSLTSCGKKPLLDTSCSATPAGATTSANCQRRYLPRSDRANARCRGFYGCAASLGSKRVSLPAFPWERWKERRHGTHFSCICDRGPQPPTRMTSTSQTSKQSRRRGRPYDAASEPEGYDNPGSWCWTHGPSPLSG